MEEERQVPEVHLDNMFMGDEKEGKTLAFLVCEGKGDKGTTGEW